MLILMVPTWLVLHLHSHDLCMAYSRKPAVFLSSSPSHHQSSHAASMPPGCPIAWATITPSTECG